MKTNAFDLALEVRKIMAERDEWKQQAESAGQHANQLALCLLQSNELLQSNAIHGEAHKEVHEQVKRNDVVLEKWITESEEE